MTGTARLLLQRSVGHVKLHMDREGVRHLREAGASKIRVLNDGQAILINTGGGIAGGDEFAFDFCSAAGAKLCITSQTAERIYRTLGPAATITTNFTVGEGASLLWLPQETIFFNGSALRRQYTVGLATGARFLAVELNVFGRTEMGEEVQEILLKDRWRIYRNEQLVHADDLLFEGELPTSKATLANAAAMATIVLVADDADRHLNAVRAALSAKSGASAWNGKLVARILAKDGFALRKEVIRALSAMVDPKDLPKVWTL